jgi:peroxiredoxin
VALSAGDSIPDVTIMTMGSDGPAPAQSASVLGKGTVVLFGVPGAFTPACSDQHLPGYVALADKLKAKGVDTVACIAVNDAFVMDAWGEARGTGDAIVMLADGNGDFAKATGLELDGSGFGLGTRFQRFAAIIEDGKVRDIGVEDVPTNVSVSSAEAVLEKL